MVRHSVRRSSERGIPGKAARLTLLAAIAVLASPAAENTTAESFRYNGSGYVTFGVGRCQHQYTNLSVSGGGQGFLWKGLALGGDIGYYQFQDQNNQGYGIGTLTVGYHFVNRDKPGRFDPFVSAGVPGVVFARGGVAAAASLGGGVTYWFKPRIGLRTEARVHVFGEEAIAMFHVGLSFR